MGVLKELLESSERIEKLLGVLCADKGKAEADMLEHERQVSERRAYEEERRAATDPVFNAKEIAAIAASMRSSFDGRAAGTGKAKRFENSESRAATDPVKQEQAIADFMAANAHIKPKEKPPLVNRPQPAEPGTERQYFAYLACPHSDKSYEVRRERFVRANYVAAKMIHAGFPVFSPISHSHHLANEVVKLYGVSPAAESNVYNYSYWRSLDEHAISCSFEIFVLTLNGWKESLGVQAEIEYAKSLGIPVYLIPETLAYDNEPFSKSICAEYV